MFKDVMDTNNRSNRDFSTAEKILLPVTFLSILFALGLYDFDIFHSLIEHMAVLIGLSIFIVSVNIYKLTPNISYSFLGVTFVFIALFELLHSSYSSTPSIAAQFSLCAQMFQTFSILSFLRITKKWIGFKRLFYIYTLITLISLYSILERDIFPQVYSIETGFTNLYYLSYLSMATVFLIGLFMLYKDTHFDNVDVKKQLTIYFCLLVTYQLLILTTDSYRQLNYVLAHIIKLISYYPVYVIVVRLAFSSPLKTIFSDLNVKNEELTKKEKLLEKQNLELIWKNKALIKANSLILSSEQKYKKLIEFLPDGILLLKETQLVLMNSNFMNMFSIKGSKDFINKSALEIVPNELRPLLHSKLQYVYDGKNIQSEEIRFELSDGRLLDIEYSILYSLIDGEKHALIILNDITEKKQLEKILNTKKLEEENEKLKMEFLSNISHELRTPINLIYSALQLEDTYINSGNVNSIKRYNRVIKQNCYRLLRIINNLIDASKIDTSFFKPHMQPMNIINLIEETTLSVVPYVESKNMSITFDTNIEEKYILCDPDLIERIMLNLLANSVKYGVYEGSICVNISDQGDTIAISIKDDGIGIPKDKKEVLFQKFMQVDKSFTRSTEGSGIGLYLVKKFVDMHGGTVTLESEEGSGVEFTITLPCQLGLEECCAARESLGKDLSTNPNIIDKANIEFADIYME